MMKTIENLSRLQDMLPISLQNGRSTGRLAGTRGNWLSSKASTDLMPHITIFLQLCADVQKAPTAISGIPGLGHRLTGD